MKRLTKFSAIMLGALATTVGFTSCSSDDDGGNSDECCSFTYTFEDDTYTYTVCRDGTYTYTSEDGVESGIWDTDEYSWSDVRAYVLSEGGSCD